ncbi:MAG: phenylalanine-4-hydroxylase [Patiriisocius sp.]|jgi:phenylalanine-4-hydroxylase
MEQKYDQYTAEDFAVWNKLFVRQKGNLKDKACAEYLTCLETLSPVLNGESIPKFSALNEVLLKTTGWQITVVPGLIPVDQFFEFLSQKRFSASTWLRSMSQLDYLEEPDMFHDIFGHIPLLLESKYTELMELIGKLGVKYKDQPEIILKLQRLYWFSIEFGLVQNGKTVIYGAGTISSYGETSHVVSDKITVLPFNLKMIFENDFINSEIQNKYYAVKSLDQLYQSIDDLETELLV